MQVHLQWERKHKIFSKKTEEKLITRKTILKITEEFQIHD